MMENQRGFALPMVLIIMVLFFVMTAGIVTMVTNEPRFAAQDENRITARYAAEAAAKMAINEIQDSLNDGIIPINKVKLFDQDLICNDSPTVVSCTYQPNDTNNPTIIQIRAIGTYRNVSTNANVNFYLKNSPIKSTPTGVVDYINTGSFAHTNNNPNSPSTMEERWKIDTDENGNKIAYTNTSGPSQVMFSDKNTKDTLNISYIASADPVDPNKSGGYGIFYGMIGNADEMNAYVVQYDPGAKKDYSDDNNRYDTTSSGSGSLLVKKIIFSPGSTPDNPTGFYDTSKITDSPGYLEKNALGLSSGGNEKYYALPFQSVNTGETIRIPLKGGQILDKFGNVKNTVTGLETLMNNYYKSIKSNKTFNVDDPHTINIVVEKDADGNLLHKILIDGNPEPILKFNDHSTGQASKYKLTSFKNTYTGLRVWDDNVKVVFRNGTASDDGREVDKPVVWIK